MKKTSFILSLLSATLLASVASAATPAENEIVTLPAFAVVAPRHTEAEKAIATNLADLRASALSANSIRVELPSLREVETAPALPANHAVAATRHVSVQERS